MPTAMNASRAAFLKKSLRKSVNLAAAIACLWPAVVNAQSWNPTATDGSTNTAAGTFALFGHTNGGAFNTAIGYAALGQTSLTGNSNTALGTSALSGNITGNDNVAAGYNAMQNNTSGSKNIALGYAALGGPASGNSNVVVGDRALLSLTSGNSNIVLGANGGQNLTSGNRNIYIGHNGAVSESNVTRIGQLQTKTFIAGIAGVAASGATVVVKANGQLGVVASSARYKTDIHDLTDAPDRLSRLRPVSYQYKTEPGVTHFGLIAEEVDKVMPELVVRDEQHRPETVQYLEIIPLLLKERQAQRAELAQQRELIARLTAKVDELSRARLAAK